jgi:hypothetical protein
LIQKLKSTNPNGLYTRSQGQCSTQLKHSYWCKSWNRPTPRGFTLGVKAKAQLKSSIPIGAKVEINPTPMGFTLGVKANVQLKSSIPIGAKVGIDQPQWALH